MSQQERPDELHKVSPATVRRTMISRGATWVGNLTLGACGSSSSSIASTRSLLTPGVPAKRSELLENERRMAAIKRAEREIVGKEQVDGSR
jgi:hypothetical protein